jgi:hypothetical protein
MHRHVRVLGGSVSDELAEGPSPRWLRVTTNRLREQSCPDWSVVEAVAVLGSDFE